MERCLVETSAIATRIAGVAIWLQMTEGSAAHEI